MTSSHWPALAVALRSRAGQPRPTAATPGARGPAHGVVDGITGKQRKVKALRAFRGGKFNLPAVQTNKMKLRLQKSLKLFNKWTTCRRLDAGQSCLY